jgi:hypothetical protein
MKSRLQKLRRRDFHLFTDQSPKQDRDQKWMQTQTDFSYHISLFSGTNCTGPALNRVDINSRFAAIGSAERKIRGDATGEK